MNENTNNISLFPSAGTAVGQVRTLEVIGAEIRTFTASMVNNIIEIGRRMCEAKEMLPYGQFGDWIKANTGYSRSTANNFMRIYQEYGSRQGCLFGAEMENDQAFGQLTYTKALALLEVPSEEREQFVEDHDVVNMSTRELQQAIAERDAAKKKLDELQFDYATLNEEVGDFKDRAEAAEARVKELEARPAEAVVDQAAIDKAVEEATKKAQADHAAILEKFKAGEEEKRKALEKKAADAEARATKAAEKLKKAESNARVLTDADGAEAEAKAAAAEAEKARAEAAELRRQLSMSGEEMVTFKLRFEAWQEAYAAMLRALAALDEEKAAKGLAAIRAACARWGAA